MRASFVFAIALSMALAGLFMAGSGFNDAMGVDDRGTTISDQLEDRADTNDTSFTSSARTEEEGSIPGFIISATETVVGVVWIVLAMPATLRELGFPRWFAYPLGLGFYVIMTIGVAQFASGRVFR